MTLYDELIRGNYSYDRIMKSKKTDVQPEKKAPWCLGKHCPRFVTMGGSCKEESCNRRSK